MTLNPYTIILARYWLTEAVVIKLAACEKPATAVVPISTKLPLIHCTLVRKYQPLSPAIVWVR